MVRPVAELIPVPVGPGYRISGVTGYGSGFDCIVVDDMIDTGSTVRQAAILALNIQTLHRALAIPI